MSIWTLVQLTFDVFAVAVGLVFWWRLKRPPQDDPRLSRGLQLLQTKITVLEDLSDRTDSQVKQLTNLVEQKSRSLQNKLLEAEQQILRVDHSMTKSREVAEIFQDKIPHQEIAERQRMVLYVKAARMAHAGHTLTEIAAQVALPREQLELIAKLNRDQLMFDESQLPEWIENSKSNPSGTFHMGQVDFLSLQQDPNTPTGSIGKIESQFKEAVEQVKKADQLSQQSLMDSKLAETLKSTVNSGLESMQPAVMSIKATAQTLKDKLVSTAEEMLRQQSDINAAPSSSKPIVKKVIFPRIEKPTNP